MDWKPWEVRQSSVADFIAAQRGWLRSRGVQDEMSEEEAAKLRMEAFGD